MSEDIYVAQHRSDAEMEMRGTCIIRRPGVPVTNPDGDVTAPSAIVYDGPQYTRYPGLAFEQNPDVAGAAVVVSRIVVRVGFPHRIPGAWVATPPQARPGDVVEITTEPDNPQMVGTKLRVASIDDQSRASAIRLVCEDFQGGVV